MIKKFLTLNVLLLTLMASDCSKITPTATADFISKVQNQAVALCGFVPLASTVANIVGAATGNAAATMTVTTVANSICAAVKPSQVNALVGETPKVNGVVVEGYFVKK